MKISVIGSTQPDSILPVKDALLFSGHEAGICYMPEDFDTLMQEPETRTMGRVRGTVGSGHHSVAGHITYNLILEGIPKILAMLLNNEHDYNASEKSGRYTKMGADALSTISVPALVGDEKAIYEKWMVKFTDLITETYPKIPSRTVDKLAKENARYFLSVFTPATTLGYTVSLRQLNYLIGFCEDYCKTVPDDDFSLRLKPWVNELSRLLREVADVEGLRDNKGRTFSLFAKRNRREEFGENYSVNYQGTFAQLAQAQRHRTLWHEMQLPALSEATFYVPPILRDEALRAEYLADMEALKANYPQGMLVTINERGTAESFLLKCHERLCGAAQLEICAQTEDLLARYLRETEDQGAEEISSELRPFLGKTKCQFGYYTCDRPCPLGPKHAFTRLI